MIAMTVFQSIMYAIGCWFVLSAAYVVLLAVALAVDSWAARRQAERTHR